MPSPFPQPRMVPKYFQKFCHEGFPGTSAASLPWVDFRKGISWLPVSEWKEEGALTSSQRGSSSDEEAEGPFQPLRNLQVFSRPKVRLCPSAIANDAAETREQWEPQGVSGVYQWGYGQEGNHSGEVTAGEERAGSWEFPVGPPPQPWLRSFSGAHKKRCILTPSHRAAERETPLVRRRRGGPKAGVSLSGCHHPPGHSPCRVPQVHPAWKELTSRGAESLQVCWEQHEPQAPCGSHSRRDKGN